MDLEDQILNNYTTDFPKNKDRLVTGQVGNNEAPRLNCRGLSHFGIPWSGIPPEDHPIHVFTERGLLLRDKLTENFSAFC